MKYRLLLACIVLPACLHAATFDWPSKPQNAKNEMAFRLFVPDSVEKVRAVIVLTPGLNGDGRAMAEDPIWQALAERTQCALFACSMKGATGGSYYEPEKWSGKIFLEALKKLAAESHHPEIADAPLVLWGHSAGGQFNFNFANWKPERTLGFVANKGGYYGETIRPATRKVPALWILGEKDTDLRVKNITAKFQDGRKMGALWALVVEPGVEHGLGRSRDLGIIFIEEILATRLSATGAIQPANPGQGWLGDPETKTVEKNSSTDSGPKNRSWFPGESTARLWAEIVGGASPQ